MARAPAAANSPTPATTYTTRAVAMYISPTKMDMNKQRHPEVLHEDQHGERQHPHDEQRAEVLEGGDGHAEHVTLRDRQHDLLVVQVAGEEDHDRQLCELRRLDAEAERVDPELGAVDRGAQEDGHHQQREADGADEVPVAVQLHVVAHDEHREDEQPGADEQPLPLGERQRRLDAEDLGEADGRQQRGDGQQERIGLRQEDALEHVQQHEDGDEHQPVDDGDAVDLAEAAGVHGHVRHGVARRRGSGTRVPCCAGSRPHPQLFGDVEGALAVAQPLLVDGARACPTATARCRRRRCAGRRRAAGSARACRARRCRWPACRRRRR